MSQPISVQDNAQPAHVARVYFSGSAPLSVKTSKRQMLLQRRHIIVYIINIYIIVQVDMYIKYNIIYINIKRGMHFKKLSF